MPHFPFQRLQADLAALIGKLPDGARLPTEPNLAKQMGVSRATLREAMRTFETQGLLRRRQGSGTYIVKQIPVIETGLEVLESLNKIAARMKMNLTPSVIQITEAKADAEHAAALEVKVGTPLMRVARIMSAESRPVAYLVDTLPEDVLTPAELTEKFEGSVLDYLLGRGDALSSSRTDITATNAVADVAKKLEVQRGDVLLQFTAKLYNTKARIVDYSFSYFLPGYFKFHIVRKVGKA